MATLDIIIVILLTGVGAGMLGYGHHLLHLGAEDPRRGWSRIVEGIGFAFMGWDWMWDPSYKFLIGAAIAVGGSFIVPLKRHRESDRNVTRG